MVPKINDLNNISAFFAQTFKEPLNNVRVVFTLNETEFKKVNEELFYKTGNSGTGPASSDEIIVNAANDLTLVFEKTPDE
jgi:hypothetical protein